MCLCLCAPAGITGFGSAILNLCVWVVATCAGINSGEGGSRLAADDSVSVIPRWPLDPWLTSLVLVCFLCAFTGTLQQAVLTECIASMVLALPLLFMTKAHATADWALVFSLSLFGVSYALCLHHQSS